MISPAHYDGRMHKVPFTIGADFAAKWEAYRADGFTVSLRDGFFYAGKLPDAREPMVFA